MALNAYVLVKGDIQGDFPGTTTQVGREDTMEVIAYTHAIRSPRDAASGAPSGKRQHYPLTITKSVDHASPYFANALSQNENLNQVRLQFFRPHTSTGTESNFYVIELTNASVSDIRWEMLNNKYPQNMNHLEREQISFVYQTITVTNNWAKTEAADDWLSPYSE